MIRRLFARTFALVALAALLALDRAPVTPHAAPSTLLSAAVPLLQAAQAPQPVDDDEHSSALPRSRTSLTFLQINDVYSTLPVAGVGGLARVATLKASLVAEGRPTLLVMAGDFLSPSVASSLFKGEQMIAALNAAGLDLATLGNHEFDFGRDVLVQRMSEAKWQWIVSNVIDTATGRPIGGAAPYLVRTIGGLKVGFIGLCLTTSEISRDNLRGIRMVDPIAAAARVIPLLKRQGARVIVAITHLPFAEDRALAERFPDIDLVIGGHEHYPVTATEGRTLISKAGSDARWVARIDVGTRPNGRVERFYELMPVTSALADEPRTAATIALFEARLDKALDNVIGTTGVALDATSDHLRTGETNIGDLVADLLKADVGADLSIVNSGTIRGDRIYPAGQVTRRTLVEMLPFGNVVCAVAVPGRVILQALNSGVAKLPETNGRFPQVSGLTFQIDGRAPVGDRIRNVRVNGASLDPAKSYTVAMPDYVLKGGDDYTMFGSGRVLVSPEAGHLMADVLERHVAATDVVAPRTDGRITTIR
jgi:5'-nucleotidase